MRLNLFVLVLLLVPIEAVAQSATSPPISNERELLSSLLSVKTGDEQSVLALLKSNRELVSPGVCNSLLQAATMASAMGDSARPLFVYGMAKDVAVVLDNKKLLAFVSYKIGRFQFEHDNIKAAIEEYLVSKDTFEQSNSHRDLVYVLAELGAVQIYAADYKKAEDYSRQSLALSESLKRGDESSGFLPDEYGPAFAWSNLGNVAE